MTERLKKIIDFARCLIVAGASTLSIGTAASFSPDQLQSSIITGAFYTDQEDISGTVIPWRFVVDYGQKIDPKTSLAIRMNSQTGIVTGPYIDGFNTQIEYFRIETVKYTKVLTDSLTTRIGLGKLKANLLKKGGSKTPMPFSNAMAKLPLKASNVAWGFQKTADNFNGAYTIGSAISNISNTTEPTNRQYSLFGEVYSASTAYAVWLQYSQENLVEIFDSDHYFSLGADVSSAKNVLNATIIHGVYDGLIGFDCGFTQNNVTALADSRLGIGYGYSHNKSQTLEISLHKNLTPNVQATASWYIQKPEGEKRYHVAGIKLEHKL